MHEPPTAQGNVDEVFIETLSEEINPVKKLLLCGAVLILASNSGSAFAQTTTGTDRGDNNASISASSTARAGQQPRPTPSPAAPVRPLSQEDQRRQQESSERRRQSAASGDPDVLLDIPNLSVEEITLKVKNLRARVSLDARLARRASRQPSGADRRGRCRHRRG